MKPIPVFKAMVKGKCPRCRIGHIFKTSPFNIKRFSEMNELCPVCLVKFETEPGFFWGAMYISYAFTVALLVIMGFGVYILFNDPELWVYMITIIGSVFLLTPLIFQYSRILMLYAFSPIKFDKKIWDEFISRNN